MVRRRLTALACLVVLAASACSTTSSQASGGPGQGPLPTIGLGSDGGQISGSANVRAIDGDAVESIVMVGDSITTAATPDLEEQFAQLGFDNVTIVSQPSKRMTVTFGDNTAGSNIVEFIANESTDVDPRTQLWVVALGTNDISQYDSLEEIVNQIGKVVEPIPADAPIVWINTYFGDRPEDTLAVNSAIEFVISQRGNATVGRWDQVAPTDGVLRGDSVHPDDSGTAIFAALVTQTVANFLQ